VSADDAIEAVAARDHVPIRAAVLLAPDLLVADDQVVVAAGRQAIAATGSFEGTAYLVRVTEGSFRGPSDGGICPGGPQVSVNI